MAVPRIASWYADWCEPIVCALYQRDPEEIRTKLAEARQAVESGEMSLEDAACLKYQLHYLELQCQIVTKSKGWVEHRLPEILDDLGAPCEHQKAEWLRSRLYLQFRITLDRLNVTHLRPTEFETIFKTIPEWEYTTELWLYISGWGFRHEQISYVEQAYEYAVLQANGFHVEWVWQRVHLMVKLMRGTAIRQDLLWLIDKIELPEQLRSIEVDIWPKAKSLGIVDTALELRIEERRLELTSERAMKVANLLKPHMKNATQLHHS